MNFIKKNFEHFGNFLNYIINHLLCIVVLILLFVMSFIILKSLSFIQLTNNQSQEIYIYGISLGNISIWFTIIGLVITAFWSIYQFTKSKTLKQQEKASEIAKDFANNLIERMGLISDVLMPNKEIENMIKKVDTSKLKQFTVVEMIEILNDNKCFDKFHSIVNSKRTQKRYIKILNSRYNKFEQQKFDSFFPLLIENTLNKLEAICINISSQAAGSQFIYESLHQVFLNTVEILCILISNSNMNNVDKYYVNIIYVYNMWNLQKKKDITKFNKTNNKIYKIQNKVDNEIKKLLNKPIKTV